MIPSSRALSAAPMIRTSLEESRMDNLSFDRLAQILTAEGSRRRLLGGLVAGAATAITGSVALGAKGKGKAKGNGKGKGSGKGYGPTGAPGKNKVGVCHLDDETGLYTYLEVPPPAMKGHQKHGDVPAPNGAADCDALNTPEPEE